MHLTREEEKALEGEFGPAVKKAHEILVALGDMFGAERLIPISGAHISGLSYRTLGDHGVHFIRTMSGARFRVPTTINPVGFDVCRWREMSISEEFHERQMEVLDVFRQMGAEPVCTCTPYHIHPPRRGEHLAYAESSAVVYANSVLGAMTNREGGPSALAAAIAGKTPLYGMHIPENRKARCRVEVLFRPDHARCSALGLYLGATLGDAIPLITFPEKPDETCLKLMGAAMAASGSIPMFHVEGMTPEWKEAGEGEERLVVGIEDVKWYSESRLPPEVDAVVIGCPHLSPGELVALNDILPRRVRLPLFVFASRWALEGAGDAVREMEMKGAKVYADTCMVVSPFLSGYRRILTNSGKAFNYLKMRKFGGHEVWIADTETIARYLS